MHNISLYIIYTFVAVTILIKTIIIAFLLSPDKSTEETDKRGREREREIEGFACLPIHIKVNAKSAKLKPKEKIVDSVISRF